MRPHSRDPLTSTGSRKICFITGSHARADGPMVLHARRNQARWQNYTGCRRTCWMKNGTPVVNRDLSPPNDLEALIRTMPLNDCNALLLHGGVLGKENDASAVFAPRRKNHALLLPHHLAIEVVWNGEQHARTITSVDLTAAPATMRHALEHLSLHGSKKVHPNIQSRIR